MIMLIPYLTLNIIILIGALNEGDVIPKEMYWRGKLVYSIFILFFGCLIAFHMVLWIATRPFIIKYKWKERQKKIRKVILSRESMDKPKDIGVGIFN